MPPAPTPQAPPGPAGVREQGPVSVSAGYGAPAKTLKACKAAKLSTPPGCPAQSAAGNGGHGSAGVPGYPGAPPNCQPPPEARLFSIGTFTAESPAAVQLAGVAPLPQKYPGISF